MNKPEISNLLSIYSYASGHSVAEIEAEYEGQMYGAFKKELGERVVALLEPLQNRYEEVRRNGEHLEALRRGAEKAKEVAQQQLDEVKRRMGFVV